MDPRLLIPRVIDVEPTPMGRRPLNPWVMTGAGGGPYEPTGWYPSRPGNRIAQGYDGIGPARSQVGFGPARAMVGLGEVSAWPKVSRDAIARMTAKYGPPDSITPHAAFWYNRGPWKRSVVLRKGYRHSWPKPHIDVLTQTIDYRVPVSDFTKLATYDGSVIVERTAGELSARCDGESMNFLAINLAHDIIVGRKTVAQARRFYEMTVRQVMAGKSPPYTRGLLFQVPRGYTGDPDRSTEGQFSMSLRELQLGAALGQEEHRHPSDQPRHAHEEPGQLDPVPMILDPVVTPPPRQEENGIDVAPAGLVVLGVVVGIGIAIYLARG